MREVAEGRLGRIENDIQHFQIYIGKLMHSAKRESSCAHGNRTYQRKYASSAQDAHDYLREHSHSAHVY
jgi:hypothetical protein